MSILTSVSGLETRSPLPEDISSFISEFSLRPSTSTQYKGLWSLWLEECKKNSPQTTERCRDPFMTNWPDRKKVLNLCRFIMILRKSGFNNRRVPNLLAAMRHHLVLGGSDTRFMSDPLVGRTIMASDGYPNSTTGTSRREETGSSRAQPLPWELLKTGRPNLWVTTLPHIREVAVYIASTLAFHLMLRISEYTGKSVYGSKAPHAIRGSDVVIQYSNADGNQTRSKQAADWLIDQRVLVTGIFVIIKSSKTFSSNEEAVRHFIRAGDSVDLNELVSDLLWWVQNAKPRESDLFFSYPCYEGQRRSLTDREVSHFVKHLAKSNGLPDRGFSSHSLRVGGASTMNTNGVDLETINQAGRWSAKSLAAIKYRNPTVRSTGALSGNPLQNSVESNFQDILRLSNSLIVDLSKSLYAPLYWDLGQSLLWYLYVVTFTYLNFAHLCVKVRQDPPCIAGSYEVLTNSFSDNLVSTTDMSFNLNPSDSEDDNQDYPAVGGSTFQDDSEDQERWPLDTGKTAGGEDEEEEEEEEFDPMVIRKYGRAKSTGNDTSTYNPSYGGHSNSEPPTTSEKDIEEGTAQTLAEEAQTLEPLGVK
eukprot:gene9462-19654_t